ncbi:MAG: sugar kinase [Deltaproteobacteria bacterium]|nr:sugar kinase [Deltaproteobacteria bacterium]
MNLLVVGSVAYDSVQTAHGSVDRALGGSATFFALASSLWARTHIVAVVGDDFRQSDLERLHQRGVDITGIEQVPGQTFRWGGVYSQHFETRTTLFTELNVFSNFNPRIGPAGAVADCVFLANIHPDLQLSVLDQCNRPRFVALDTMNFWIAGERPSLERVLRRVDCVFVNDEEAYALSGVGNLSLAARRIHAMGPRTVIIKRGEHGAVLFCEGKAQQMPAVMLDDVVDPTGAGDSFAGGFMGYVASQPHIDTRTLQAAVVVGTLTASFAVQGFSVDRLETLTIDDLAVRYDALVANLLPATVEWSRLRNQVRPVAVGVA